MKIVHKINLTNVFAIIFIALIAWYAYQNLNLVLTKVKFVEIADDLNSSFLEMRLAEKNYFLYKDRSILNEIKQKLRSSLYTLDLVEPDITKAIGQDNFDSLRQELEGYQQTLDKVQEGEPMDESTRRQIRDTGQSLREFSSHITILERAQVNKIIAHSKTGLIYSFLFILVCSIGVSYAFFFSVTRSLKKIEAVAHSISQGNYERVPTSNSNDEVGSVITAINTMSEELQSREEQILQSKKLASIGILTAGVAHELGNPLNNISMLAQAYIEVYENLAKEDRISYMQRIEEETDRIKEIVKNLLDFSRPKKPNLKPAAINVVVNKSLKLVQNLIHINNIDCHLELLSRVPPVVIDENQIQEVLVNLITNSVQATPPGGRINISTNFEPSKDLVEISIEDTGKGIPNDLVPHLFDPFFTTKGSSGMGLGLFVSYGIIKTHQGDIRVESHEGSGTRFTIELPAHKMESEEK